MIILGIESSCDETAASLVEDGIGIIAENIASSQELHRKTGGIIPEVAAREQIKSIIPVIEETVSVFSNQNRKDKASIKKAFEKIDAIAVTSGPGLISSLLVGIETAKTLSLVFEKPLVPVNHLKGHLYANWLLKPLPEFPAIGLLVSGGHTDLILMKSHQETVWIGGTRDDAAGECFDKTARILNLGYPGGPAISKAAEKSTLSRKRLEKMLPRPMINQKNLDFSFSGLKTAVLNSKEENKNDLAAAIQLAIVDSLTTKTIRALEKYKAKSLLVAGGVSANKLLREELIEKIKPFKNTKLFIPEIKLCTDNASYIASCAFFNYSPLSWRNIQANPSLAIEEMIE